MALINVCLLVFAFVVSAQAIGFRGFTYEGRKEPEIDISRASVVIEKRIEQPVDHFNVRDNRTWSMRYYENNEFLNDSGPIFIMLGGEWKITPGFVLVGLMYDIAKEHGAMMYYTEHRYYGDSRPVNDTTSANLQYLNVDQALADVANFIDSKKNENPSLANSSVIVFGGSYAGNMAAWARIKYPHLIQGAIASSAPVQAKANFFEYYDVVTTSLARFSEHCTEDINDAFSSVEILLNNSTEGPELLKKLFNLCQEPDISSPSIVAFLMTSLQEQFAGTVQYNRVGKNGTSSISKICDSMMNETLGSPIMRLANLVTGEKCLDIDYNEMIATLRNDSWEKTGATKLWLYQTCTEYGYYQTTGSNNSIFGNRVPFEFYVQLCSDIYGEYYDLSLLDLEVRRTNIMYGGSLPDVENVVFTNGNIDPWHALSVLEDLNEKSPAILIDGSSHCEDLYPDTETDVVELSEARERERSIIADWLSK